jgi:hypothetical protein
MLVVLLSVSWLARAQDRAAPYPSMAPIDQYLMPDRNAEIALARSAAPAAISGNAEVLVLGRQGYQTAVPGKNGFVCVVERSWMSPFDIPEFWNPKVRGPLCFNPPAARSVLPFTYKRTELALAGRSKTQMIAAIKSALDKKELPALEPAAMSYMMSKDMYLGDLIVHFQPHLMYYVPKTNGADWGADLPNSPVFLNRQFEGTTEPLATFVVPVPNWADGTRAPVHEP